MLQLHARVLFWPTIRRPAGITIGGRSMSLADPKRLLPYFVLLWMTTSSQPSLACPDDQYEQCTLGVCVCLPEIGGDVGRGAEHLKNEIRGQTGAPALEAWLRGSRNTAVGTSQPIPSNIRQELSGYIEMIS
jgi:hypothetical protein